MTAPLKTAVSFTLILLLGIGIFIWQSRRLDEVRTNLRMVESLPLAKPRTSATTEEEPSAGFTPIKKSVIARLGEKLFASIEVSKIAPVISSADQLSRIVLAANLDKSEEPDFKRAFEQFDIERTKAYLDTGLTDDQRTAVLAGISERMDTWITEHLDPARAASLQTAEANFKRAKAEQNASRAVSRIVNSVSLTDEQKDQLYSGFLERELQPSVLPTAPMKLQPYGNVSVEPSVPNITQEAQKILTPEQWHAYQDVRANTLQIEGYQQMLAMQRMYPILISKLQEVLDEDQDAGTAR